MKTTGAQLFRKLNVLLAILLCSVLAFVQPVTAQAASHPDAVLQQSLDVAEKAPLVLLGGHFISGEALGVPQLERALLAPLVSSLLHRLYPIDKGAAPSPHASSVSKDDCGLYTILTKGP